MSNDEFISGNGYGQNQSANVSFGNPQPASGQAGEPVKDISTAEFAKEVIEASQERPVLIDFWAPWCGPCKQLAPELERAVAATNGKVKLVKMDIDKNPEIPGQMGIQSIPAVVAFVNGRPADAFMGAKPESEIREFISKVSGPDPREQQIEEMLDHADQLAEQGATGEAAGIFSQVLSAEPGNLRALSAMGHLYLNEGNMDGARGVLEMLDDAQKNQPEIASLISAIELAEQASSLGDLAGLEQAVQEAPNDHQNRLDLAVALNGAGKREEAADHLLEIIRRQPGWNEDAARTQLLQFFEAWGLTDEVTVSSRRKLSSILFS